MPDALEGLASGTCLEALGGLVQGIDVVERAYAGGWWDPVAIYSSTAHEHLMQKVSWLMQPMSMLMGQQLQTPADYPPVQGGASFDISNVVADFLENSMQ